MIDVPFGVHLSILRNLEHRRNEVDRIAQDARSLSSDSLSSYVESYNENGFPRLRRVLDVMCITDEPAKIVAYRNVLSERK